MKGVHMLSKNVDLNNTVILVTGAAGFVGANLVMSLLSEAEGTQIIGIDSVNDYYDVALKDYRLQQINEMSNDNKNTWIFLSTYFHKSLSISIFTKTAFNTRFT